MIGPRIHPTAIIGRDVRVAADVAVGPYVIIQGPAEIGAGAKLGFAACVGPGSRIGEGVSIHARAIVGCEPQTRKWDPGIDSGCVIGSGTIVREGAAIARASTPGRCTTVGRDCYLMMRSHIDHDCTVGDRVVMVNGAMLAGHVEVEDDAYLSAGALVHQFVRIGRLALLSVGTRVGLDVPPYHIAEGRNRLRGLNRVGMKRAGFSPELRASIQKAHRLLFRGDADWESALRALEREFPEPEIAHLARFCRKSRRGVLHRRAAAFESVS